MVQQEFNLTEGRRLKEDGMEKACRPDLKAMHLDYAKDIAISVAMERPDRTCTIDDVQCSLIPLGIELGNASGSVFKGKHWKWNGRVIQSKRVSNHARMIKEWELVG